MTGAAAVLPRWIRTFAVFTAISVVCTGCASTVQIGSGSGPGEAPLSELSAGEGLSLPTAPAADSAGVGRAGVGNSPGGGTAADDGGTGADSPLAPGATAGDRHGAPVGADGTAPGERAAAGSAAPGVTADKIFLGFAVTENGSSANDAIGASGVTQGRPREYVRIVVEDLNRRGGIAGREVEPVIFAFDAQSTMSDAQQQEQACVHWTEDNEVFAAAAPAQYRDSVRTCMSKRGVPLLGTGVTLQDATGMARFPLYAEVATMNLTRVARNLVAGLSQQDYFAQPSAAAQTRLGILRFDYPTFERASNEALKPALAATGHAEPEEFAVRVPENSSDLGGTAADINAAILQFRQANVTHVVILETTAILALLFMRSAESQNYRPRYGLHSQNGGMVLAGLVPAEQLHDSVGIGWLPQGDVRDADVPANGARRRCLALMRNNGLQFPDSNAKAVALNYCDQAEMFKAAVEAGGSLTGTGFIRGVENQGTRFAATQTFATRFSPRRHDGADGYRHVRFFDDCACFRYTSRVKRAS